MILSYLTNVGNVFKRNGFSVQAINGNELIMTHQGNPCIKIKLRVKASNQADCVICDSRFSSFHAGDCVVGTYIISVNDDIKHSVQKILELYKSRLKPFAITGKVMQGREITHYQLCDGRMATKICTKMDVYRLAKEEKIQSCKFQTYQGRELLRLGFSEFPVLKYNKNGVQVC